MIAAAIAVNSDDARYHANLGRVLKAVGDPQGAEASYRRAIELDAGDAEVRSDLAAVLLEKKDPAGAAEAATAALAVDSRSVNARLNLALALEAHSKPSQAKAALEIAVGMSPERADLQFHLGRLAQDMGLAEEAAVAYGQVSESSPAFVDAQCNLGNILRDGDDLEGAVECYRRALAADPEVSEVHANLGVALQESGHCTTAIASYREAVRLNPGNADGHRNLAMALLQGGDFREGWQEMEWRWKTKRFAAIRRIWPKPMWRGEPLAGETVLVHHEQGYGDSLQFGRYLPLLAARGARVVVEFPDALARLMAGVEGVVDARPPGEEGDDFDYHAPIMSLPFAFESDLDNVPAAVPYLDAGAEVREKWAARVGETDALRVGVVWKGRRDHPNDRRRSPGLSVLAPLFTVSGTRFFSLQKDGGGEDIAAEGLETEIENLAPSLDDFAETAGAIQHLDLVLSADTAVAHLAGALAKPVWIMLPHVAEWRWLTDRDDSPWYPTARLFRQPDHGDWASVVRAVAAELAAAAEQKKKAGRSSGP